jgi:hypothetical protein
MNENRMPKPTDEHRKLHAFAGEWEGEEKMSPTPWGPGGAATGRYRSRVDMDGFFVVQDYEQIKDGRVTYRGHGIFGIDGGAVAWYWVDSIGQMPQAPARGAWAGDTLTLESSSPQGKSRYVLRLEGAGTLHFRIESSFDGGATFSPFMEGTYRRK